jgi:hypothetical protein
MTSYVVMVAVRDITCRHTLLQLWIKIVPCVKMWGFLKLNANFYPHIGLTGDNLGNLNIIL